MSQQPNLVLDLPWFILLGGAALLLAFVLFAVVLVVSLLRGRRKPIQPPPVDLRLQLAECPTSGPPHDGPQLEFYGTPVRLAALILAPAGRNQSLPSHDDLSEAIESLIPGLSGVVGSHETVMRKWPAQLSAQGFTHSFFNNVSLPGDRGKGTPWCSAAGKFEFGAQQLLAGLLCVADKPNSMSQLTVTHIGQWMDVLRVK